MLGVQDRESLDAGLMSPDYLSGNVFPSLSNMHMLAKCDMLIVPAFFFLYPLRTVY